MKHFFDAVADNVALQEEFEHTLPRTRDQVKEQLIMPIDQANRSGENQKLTRYVIHSESNSVLAALDLWPDVTKLIYRTAGSEPTVPCSDFPQPVR